MLYTLLVKGANENEVRGHTKRRILDLGVITEVQDESTYSGIIRAKNPNLPKEFKVVISVDVDFLGTKGLIETKLGNWFNEDIGTKPPFPAGSLLLWTPEQIPAKSA